MRVGVRRGKIPRDLFSYGVFFHTAENHFAYVNISAVTVCGNLSQAFLFDIW